MSILEDVIESYCKSLRKNDYQTFINLFSGDNRVFSFFAGEKSPEEFFQNSFAISRRANVILEFLHNLIVRPECSEAKSSGYERVM